MDDLFTLSPNHILLDKYGYQYLTPDELGLEQPDYELSKLKTLLIKSFNEYNIEPIHHDTLIYICLAESNNAEIRGRHQQEVYYSHERVKQLASLLLLFNPANRFRPSVLKISNVVESLTLNDNVLVEMIGDSLRTSILNLDFKWGEVGLDALGIISVNRSTGERELDYKIIETLAKRTIRKPSVRNRNRNLARFLLNVLRFVQNETTLVSPPFVKFSDKQLKLLYDVATLFGWFGDGDFRSLPEDYLATLLTNYLKQTTGS